MHDTAVIDKAELRREIYSLAHGTDQSNTALVNIELRGECDI